MQDQTSFLFTYEVDGDVVMRSAFAVSEKAFVDNQTCRGRSVAGVFGEVFRISPLLPESSTAMSMKCCSFFSLELVPHQE